MEAQRRLVMEQTMAYQQQYAQYPYGMPPAGMYGAPPPPPMMPGAPYGAMVPPPPPMPGYGMPADYYGQQPPQAYDPNAMPQQMPPPAPGMEGPQQQPQQPQLKTDHSDPNMADPNAAAGAYDMSGKLVMLD